MFRRFATRFSYPDPAFREHLNELLAKHTGQPIKKIEKDTDRNFFMSSDKAKEYGIVDQILTRRPKQNENKGN